jgi:cytochrome o ubiquinol oxidase subunit 2
MKRVGKSLRAQRSLITALVIGLLIVTVLVAVTREASFSILQSKGTVANDQRDLIVFVTVLSLVVIIPVIIMVFVITWRYRADKPRGKYRPGWHENKLLETIWWGVPILIIAVLSFVIYSSSHKLDPFRALDSDKRPITVQVVALQWKWLFIYPEQGIATVNYMQFPEDTPVKFEVTADSPMNAFWIPQLGGQIYAMNGMQSEINLMADEIGVYDGSSSNISGEGFSKMRFKAEAVSQANFDRWATGVKSDKRALTSGTYTTLAAPGTDIPIRQYGSVEKGLFGGIIAKFMGHGNGEAAKPETEDDTASAMPMDHGNMTAEEHQKQMNMEGN